MTRFLNKIPIWLQGVLIISWCLRECASLNIRNNHRTSPFGIGSSVHKNPQASPSSSSQELRVQTLSFGYENDSHQELGLQALSVGVTRNATEPGQAWSSFVPPSVPALPTENTATSTVEKIQLGTFLGCAVSAFLAIVLKSSPGSWRFFLAGGLCAAISHTIPTPIDVVKTRKQVDPALTDKSFLETGRYIVKEEGFSALWAGLGPTTFGYLLEGAIKFGVYEVLKPALKFWLTRIASISTSLAFLNSQFITFVLSGIVSGLAASFVLCPMETLRIRLVAEPNYTSGNWIKGGFKILRREGVHGFTKGMKPMILKQVPYTVTKNVSFDLFTKFFYTSLLASGVATVSNGMKFAIPLVSAAIASVLSSLTSQPGDTILSLACAHDGDYRTRDISQNIIRGDRGIAGFFVGTKTRLLHVGIIVTIQLLIYDYVKRLVGIAATGL